MVENLRKIYELQKTKEYKDADSVWICLKEDDKYKLEKLVGKKIYATLVFVRRELMPKIEDNCDLAFDCKEDGFSYHIGCYFQNKEYSCVRNIKVDISRFYSLLKIYDKDKFPKEVELINKIIDNLQSFVERCKTYELDIDK